jgi:DNA end-binding protein Ku
VPTEDAKRAGVTARELTMAKKLIDDMAGKWTPDEYHDTFRDDILELVERKVRSGKIEEIEDRPAQTGRAATNVVDLTELLKRSLKGGGGARASDLRDERAEEEAETSPPAGARRKPAAKSASKGAAAKTAAKRPATKRAATGEHAAKKTAVRRKHAA